MKLLFLKLCIFMGCTITPSGASGVGISYTWEKGYWSQSHQLGTASEPRLCMPQVAENMIVKRVEIDGAQYYENSQQCYSAIVGGSSYHPEPSYPTYHHVEFLLLLALYQVSTIPVADIFTLYTRVKLPVGECTLKVYSIDSLQQHDSMQQSSRMLIQSQKSPVTDMDHTTLTSDYARTFNRHNVSRWVNSIEEKWMGIKQDTFTSLDIDIKMGDTDVEEGHQQWMVTLATNPSYTEISLTAITVTRPAKECSLLVEASSYIENEVMRVWMNASTSGDCNADIKDLNVIFHGEEALTYRNHSWGELSMIPQALQNVGRVFAFMIPRLYIDSYVYLEMDHDVELGNMFMGTKNMTVGLDIFWRGHVGGVESDNHDTLMLQSPVTRRGQQRFWVRQNNATQQINTTSSSSDTHEFYCRPPTGSQIAPCYIVKKSTGSVQYMPASVVKVIGYNTNTASIYGRTAKGHVVDFNADQNPAAVILSTQRWNELFNSGDVVSV